MQKAKEQEKRHSDIFIKISGDRPEIDSGLSS
jgi:hypothetical protein